MMTPSDALDRLQLTLNCSEVSLSETIRVIQKDAYVQACRDIADECSKHGYGGHGLDYVEIAQTKEKEFV